MNTSPRSDSCADEQLVAAINNGDAEAFEALYYRYRDWVVRLAYRFTGNQDDALEVMQETFAYLVRKFPGFRLTASMTTFLYPAVKNLSLAHVRKRRHNVTDDEVLAAATVAGGAGAEDVRDELATAMARLSEAQREVLLLRFVDDLTLDEIARSLDIPLGTVKSRLHNALQALRNDAATKRYFEIEEYSDRE